MCWKLFQGCLIKINRDLFRSGVLQLREKYKSFSNISFTGPVEEEELRSLIGNAIATLYIPVDEDFGMSPVESMAAGKPVIGVREGGLIETVMDGETGILLNADPSIEQIRQGVMDLSPTGLFPCVKPVRLKPKSLMRKFLSIKCSH